MSLLHNEGIELGPQRWWSGLLKRASQAPEKARQDPKAVKTIKLKGAEETKSWREGSVLVGTEQSVGTFLYNIVADWSRQEAKEDLVPTV